VAAAKCRNKRKAQSVHIRQISRSEHRDLRHRLAPGTADQYNQHSIKRDSINCLHTHLFRLEDNHAY
jgi:hypothetical protein